MPKKSAKPTKPAKPANSTSQKAAESYEFTSGVNSSDFTWVSAGINDFAYITIDNQLRLYFNVQARKMIGADRVVIGYDFANKRLIVGNPEVVRPTNVRPHKLNKRGYASARPLVRKLMLPEESLPLRFEYVGKDYTVDGSLAFEMVGDPWVGGDGGL